VRVSCVGADLATIGSIATCALIDLPDSSVFSAVLADRRFIAAAAISALSGLVRRFSGFGSALTYVPLMAAVYDPRIAAASFLLIDFATGLAFVFGVWRQAQWREIVPLVTAALAAAQFGTLILQYADPVLLRWGIALFIAALLPVLMSGWRYHGRPLLIVTIAVGLLGGTLGGAIQVSGPPIILYWLGSMHEPAVLRANFICYFAIFAAGSVVTYVAHGLLTAPVIALALMAGPLHIFAMWLGGRFFHFASEHTYRRIAYGVIAAAALVSMPLFDRLLR
jgi:uncharacterized protein